MNNILNISLILSLVFCICLANDCIGKPNGEHVHQACNYYVECQNEQEVSFYCNPPTVYNYLVRRCDSPNNTPPPCGGQEKCTNLPDGKYPILNLQCRCYFTCRSGFNIGTQCCPDTLVWDVYENICNWDYNVPPPCGIKPPQVTYPPSIEPTTDIPSGDFENIF